jgi:hypothetical protein
MAWGACAATFTLASPVGIVRAEEAPASIRQQVRQTGEFERIVVARDNQLQLAGLVGNAELIVEASAGGARTFLSDDGADIYTDYTFKVHAILKNARRPGLRAGHSVTVRRQSGEIVVDGHTVVSHENEFPPFDVNEHYVLFLTPEPGESMYSVFGGAKGAFSAGDRIRAVRISVDDASDPVLAVSREVFLGDVRALLKFSGQ